MKIEIGETYSGIGYSGMTNGIRVTGELTEYIFEHQHATLKDVDGRLIAVNSKTLKYVGDKDENKVAYIDKIYHITTTRSKEEKMNPFEHDEETSEKLKDIGRWTDTTKSLSERLKNYKNKSK